MRNMQADDLGRLAQQGDQGARTELLRRGANILRAHCKAANLFLPGGERADLVQVGLIGWDSAIDSWVPDRSRLIRWARWVATRDMLDCIRKASRRLARETPIDDEILRKIASVPSEDVPMFNGDGPLMQLLLGGLTERERSVVQAVMIDGLRWPEAQQSIGITVRALDGALQRAKRRIRTAATAALSNSKLDLEDRYLIARFVGNQVTA